MLQAASGIQSTAFCGGIFPDQLPVRVPSKYELAINLKTAKALGLSVPQSLACPRR
jgi:hypothetical protein